MTLLLAVAAAGACTVKETKAPALSGPSELGLSLTIQATPDVLTQDGSSQAQVVVLARDANSQPARNVTCRVDILVNNVVADFGSVSSKTVTTGSDGRAVLYYTAPPAPLAVTIEESAISLLVTPMGTDFAGDFPRAVQIRLVPPGDIIPPSTAIPGFTMEPEAIDEGESVAFDAPACEAGKTPTNCTQGVVVSYAWNFGDGGSGSGRTVTHRYDRAGTYSVTLTVTDAQGRHSSTTRAVTVSAAAVPTAAFEFSPSEPVPGDVVYFNASASMAAPGRTITRYDWDFGDGSHGSGVTPSHGYAAVEKSYTATLTVTDDAGRKGSVSKVVKVAVPKSTLR